MPAYPKRKKRRKKKKKTKGIIPKKSKIKNKYRPKKICDFFCRHEKCHHLKFVKYLKWQKEKYNINFFASLLPYQTVHHTDKYGIINGMPDFFIDHPLKDENGRIIKTSLYIELKVGYNKLTPNEKNEIKKILEKGNSLVGVNYGIDSCKKLMKSYRDGENLEKLEIMCWAGKTNKKHLEKK
jgi:hypothetical protein